MSMGNIESFHQIVDEKLVKKAVGAKLFNSFNKLFDKFLEDEGAAEMSDALNDGGDGFNDGCCDFDQEDEKWVKVKEAYNKVTEAFKKETGMTVNFIYFSGDGDCYDDLDSSEWYWELNFEDVWVPKKLTKKAEEFQKKYGNIDTDQRFSCYG
jgi:hypothetical protein